MNERPEDNLTLPPEPTDEEAEAAETKLSGTSNEAPERNTFTQPEIIDEEPEDNIIAPSEITVEEPTDNVLSQPEAIDEESTDIMAKQPETAVETSAHPGKKSPGGQTKKIGIAVCAVLVVAVTVFLLSFFSANARFNRAMGKNDYEAAEEILNSNQLKASEKNDSHFLTLADLYVDHFNSNKDDYETAMQKIIDLKSAEIYADETREEIENREKKVIESHLGKIYNSYNKNQLAYDAAVKQINESNPFDEDIVKSFIDKYISKTNAKREEFYAEAILQIADNIRSHTPEELIEILEPFGDFRNAQALTGIFNEIKEEKGIEAAKLLMDYKDSIKDNDDVIEEESTSEVFDEIKYYLLDRCFDTNSSDYGEKLAKRIGLNYTYMLLDDSSRKVSELLGDESSKALNLGKELDLSWFKNCKGGTGKILYIARYIYDTSSDSRDEYYYYYYEDIKDVPLSKMPESLEDVEYVVIFDEGGKFYADYYSDEGQKVLVYRRTAQVTVRQYPSGEVIYNSGEISGPTPKDSFKVNKGTKYAYGGEPDVSAAKAKVKELLQLE